MGRPSQRGFRINGRTRRETLRLANGFCYECGEPREGEGATRTRCQNCARRMRANALRRKERLIKAGLCTRCREPRGEGATLTVCADCRRKIREESKAYFRGRREGGRCGWCGKPSGRFSLCLEHRCAQSERRRHKPAPSQPASA